MKLEWMREHREIIRALIRYANLYAHIQTEKLADGAEDQTPLSSQEWQTLECVLEFEGENLNMATLAGKLGIPASNFSNYVKTLVDYGFVERFQRSDNRKEIILLPTEAGRALYLARSEKIAAEWAAAFAQLDRISAQDRRRFLAFMEELTLNLETGDRRHSFLRRL